jgi:hypothetical protein
MEGEAMAPGSKDKGENQFMKNMIREFQTDNKEVKKEGDPEEMMLTQKEIN